jgi:hypothetical protein
MNRAIKLDEDCAGLVTVWYGDKVVYSRSGMVGEGIFLGGAPCFAIGIIASILHRPEWDWTFGASVLN